MSVYVSNGLEITDETARQVARSLKCLGSGVSRSVYDLGDVVLKIDDGGNHAGNCASEVACWEEFEGTEHEHLFARILAYGRGWIIAEKAPTDYALYRSQEGVDVRSQLEWLGIGDLHDGNIGFREDGSGCAIDYAYNSHRHDVCSDSEPSECECGDHDCRDCYPDGCDCCCDLHNFEGCGTFEGCNAVECEECYADATVHIPEAGEWFGFLFGVVEAGEGYRAGVGIVRPAGHLHYCTAHAPHAEHETPTQVIGQLGFWHNGNELELPFWSRYIAS